MHPPRFPTFETPRLRLRELRHDDVPGVEAVHANVGHIGLATQLGFQPEGRLREGAFWNDNRHDMLRLGLLQREFIAF